MDNYKDATLTHSGHPLSRHFIHFSGLPLGQCDGIGNVNVKYITAAYYFIRIRQHELCHGLGHKFSRKLLSEYEKLSSPHMLDDWIDRQNIPLDPSWIRLSGDIYYSILTHLLEIQKDQTQENGFASVMKQVIADLQHQQKPLAFLHCQPREMVYSCGIRYATASKYQENGRLNITGANFWGDLLGYIAKDWANGQLNPRWSVGEMINSNIFPQLSSPLYKKKKGVLIISDSILKFVHGIKGGYVLRQGGGTFKTLAKTLLDNKIELAEYGYIIINCGFNDCQLSYKQQRESWQAFKEIVEPEIRRRESQANTILISLPFEHPRFKSKVASYLLWMQRQVERYNISLNTWRNGCPFISDSGSLKSECFESDEIHLSHRGFRLLWLEWGNFLTGLEFHKITLSPEQYQDSSDVKSFKKDPSRKKKYDECKLRNDTKEPTSKRHKR